MWPPTHNLFHPPPAQALVIERMHAGRYSIYNILPTGSFSMREKYFILLFIFPPGARRFVVLDFGHPILLTDVVIPACADLASISVDIWLTGEETDGHRLVVSSDIGLRSLIMNDIMPPPICRYLKVSVENVIWL